MASRPSTSTPPSSITRRRPSQVRRRSTPDTAHLSGSNCSSPRSVSVRSPARDFRASSVSDQRVHARRRPLHDDRGGPTRSRRRPPHRSPPALRSRQLARSPTPSCAALGPVKAAPSRAPPLSRPPFDATWRTGRLTACLGCMPAPASPRPADLRDAVACRGAPVKAPQARCDSNGLCPAAEGGSGIA